MKLPHYAIFFALPQILLSTIFLNTLNLCSRNVRNQVLHLHKTRAKLQFYFNLQIYRQDPFSPNTFIEIKPWIGSLDKRETEIHI